MDDYPISERVCDWHQQELFDYTCIYIYIYIKTWECLLVSTRVELPWHQPDRVISLNELILRTAASNRCVMRISRGALLRHVFTNVFWWSRSGRHDVISRICIWRQQWRWTGQQWPRLWQRFRTSLWVLIRGRYGSMIVVMEIVIRTSLGREQLIFAVPESIMFFWFKILKWL